MMLLSFVNATAIAVQDPLPSWNDGLAKQAIINFIVRVTKEASPDFVPVPERIDVWRKPFETLRAPIVFDLRSDPSERGQEGIGYNDWWYRRSFYAIPAQKIVGDFLASFKKFPLRQKPGSFTVGKALEVLSQPSNGSP